jgi:hypothetical protein
LSSGKLNAPPPRHKEECSAKLKKSNRSSISKSIITNGECNVLMVNRYFEKMNSHTVSLDYVVAYKIELQEPPKLHAFFQAAIDSMASSYSDVYRK